jgi:hypothetical protein
MRDLVATFEAAGVVFLEPQADHDGGVVYKKGFDFSILTDDAASAGRKGSKGTIDASGLDHLDDWELSEVAESTEPDEPLPPLDWTDEDRADQIEHWRSRPEVWAKLHEISRQCLLRAMGVERL